MPRLQRACKEIVWLVIILYSFSFSCSLTVLYIIFITKNFLPDDKVHSLFRCNWKNQVTSLSLVSPSADFSNAFNSIDHSVLSQEVCSKIPTLSPWLECCYGAQPHILFGDYTILGCSGVQQGDTIGPLAFSLVLHPLVERIQREVPVFLFNGGTWTMALYVAPLRISFLPWPYWRRMAHLMGSTSTTPNLSCSSCQTLLTLPSGHPNHF